MLESVNPRLVFAIAFVTGIIAVLWFDRNKIERHSILFIRRTQHGIELLDKVAKKAPRFWNGYAWAGVIAAIISLPLMVFQMGWIVNNFISTGSAEGGPSAILPGLTSEQTIGGNLSAGVTFIPVEYWVVSIAIIMIVHEASHGIVARMEDFEINSVGWLVLGIIPGAFVEPKGMELGKEDDQDANPTGMWDQGNWKQRLKVLSAGSWANYVTALILFVSAIGVTSAVVSPTLMYQSQEGFAAAEAGMTSGEIQQINNVTVTDFDQVSTVLQDVRPGDTVTVKTSEREQAFSFEAGEREGMEQGYLGLQFSNISSGWRWFINLINMAAFLNLAIGMFNMLPAKPLDGGHILDTFVERFGKESQRKYVNYFSAFMWIIVLGSLIAALIL
jgi:hypothetical protein